MEEQEVCQGKTELKETGPDITLRDFFAGCALMSREIYLGEETKAECASQCYLMADAMLKAREEE